MNLPDPFFPLLALFLLPLSLAKEAEKPVVGPEKGTLVIMGGGGKDRTFPEIFARFVELAGGDQAQLVIVPTAASSDPDHNYGRSWAVALARNLNVAGVTILHTHDREKANTEAFAKPLKKATGVWFGGGRQWRLTKAYGGTRTEKEFHQVLARGGVIGGSSAGATIQGSFLARGDTSGNTIMVGDVQRGFAFLKNTAIDQHLIARGRQKDLIKVLEDPEGKMRDEFDRDELLGIGIDEDVAIVVTGDRFDVIGKKDGQVLVYDPKKWQKNTPAREKWITLTKGQHYDLAARKVIDTTRGAKLRSKLDNMVLPEVDFKNATIEEAVEFLRLRSIELDQDQDPGRRGISFLVKSASGIVAPDRDDLEDGLEEPSGPASHLITYSAKEISIPDLVAEVARQGKFDAFLTSTGMMLVPEGESPFPNSKSEKGKILKIIRKAQ